MHIKSKIILGLIIFLGFNSNAFASTILEQNVSDTFWDMNTHTVQTTGFPLGTGLEGDITDGISLEIAVENQHTAGSVDFVWDLKKCDNSDYTSCITIASFSTNVPERYTKTFASDTDTTPEENSLDNTKYYYLNKAGNQYNDDRIFGNSSYDIYIKLEGLNTSPYINIITPKAREVSTTPFDFPYWKVDFGNLGSTNKKISMHYAESSTILDECLEFPYGETAGYEYCINSGNKFYVDYGITTSLSEIEGLKIIKSKNLNIGQSYYAQAIVQEEDEYGEVIAYSDVIEFVLGESINSDIPVTCESLDFFCHLKKWGSWLFIPTTESLTQFQEINILERKPFSYISDMQNVWDEFLNSSSTQTLSITANLSEIDPNAPDIDLFSTSIVENLSFYSTIRNIIGFMLYISLAYLLYRKIITIHDTNHKTI